MKGCDVEGLGRLHVPGLNDTSADVGFQIIGYFLSRDCAIVLESERT